jgi:hypothetical protein
MVNDWTEITTTAVSDSLVSVINYIPLIIGALIVILIGVVVAWAVKIVIVKGLGFIKIKKYTDAVGLGKVFTEKVEFVDLIGDIAKWTVIVVFLLPALEILKLNQVGEVVTSILEYIPNVIIAVVAIVVGAIVADLVARTVKSGAATIGVRTADIAADIARWAIIVFVALGALQQLNILPELISTITIGAVAFLVIAGGLAFGLGGKDAAAAAIARVGKNFPK